MLVIGDHGTTGEGKPHPKGQPPIGKCAEACINRVKVPVLLVRGNSKALLRRAFDAQASELLALRARYARYEFVLAEPYYVFPADWAADDNWRALRGDWERVFARARALADEVELVSENEEDVGIFLAVCSPPSLVLSGHAASLTPN